MSVAELGKLIGKEGLWEARNGLLFRVEVTDARGGGWGRTDVLIRPLAGHGTREAWVSLESVQLFP